MQLRRVLKIDICSLVIAVFVCLIFRSYANNKSTVLTKHLSMTTHKYNGLGINPFKTIFFSKTHNTVTFVQEFIDVTSTEGTFLHDYKEFIWCVQHVTKMF